MSSQVSINVTERELAALAALSSSLEIPQEKVLIQALRTYESAIYLMNRPQKQTYKKSSEQSVCMLESEMSELSIIVTQLLVKASDAKTANEALQFSQAACNAANAICIVGNIKQK